MFIRCKTTYIPNNAARFAFRNAARQQEILCAVLCPAIEDRQALVVVATGAGSIPCTVEITEAPTTLLSKNICNVHFHVDSDGEQFSLHGNTEYFFGQPEE